MFSWQTLCELQLLGRRATDINSLTLLTMQLYRAGALEKYCVSLPPEWKEVQLLMSCSLQLYFENV